MEAVKIVLLCVSAAVIYGVSMDQVTARVCLEYFTIGHPPVFDTRSPTLLGLGWGVIATWWVGFLLGLPLAWVSRRGRPPKRTARSLLRPVVALLLVMGLVSFAAGLLGYTLASAGVVILVEPLASQVPLERHEPFLADLWAHVASYLVGALGGILLIAWVGWSRWNRRAGGGEPR